jgi:hypothetical protein
VVLADHETKKIKSDMIDSFHSPWGDCHDSLPRFEIGFLPAVCSPRNGMGRTRDEEEINR